MHQDGQIGQNRCLHVQGRHHRQRPRQRILRREEISILRAILNTKGIRQGALCVYTLRRKAQIRISVCYFRAKKRPKLNVCIEHQTTGFQQVFILVMN